MKIPFSVGEWYSEDRGTRCLNFQHGPAKGTFGGKEREYRTRQCFDNSGDSPAPRFFSHPQPCNSKWCVLHSRVWCNIATCIRRVLHTGNYKWTKPSCRPTLLRCQIEWWHARHATLSPPPRFLPPNHAHLIVITISLSFCIFHSRSLTHNCKIMVHARVRYNHSSRRHYIHDIYNTCNYTKKYQLSLRR